MSSEKINRLRVVSWNIAQRDKAWQALLESEYDIALLQEAHEPNEDLLGKVEIDPGEWRTAGVARRNWRTAIVRLSDKFNVEWIKTQPIDIANPGELAVSRMGTITAAKVTPQDSEPIVFVSVYATWEKPLEQASSNWIYADGSVHRIASDLSAFLGRQNKHRVIVAGDFNTLNGYGEHGSPYWADRYNTVFNRFAALNLPFVGPRAPNGRRANPWPDELPVDSDCVPTFHTTHQTPKTATRQLDFVFASKGLHRSIFAKARNEIHDWGPSDHCRIDIEVRID